MNKDLEYYLSLDYPIESYFGEHEIGDAYLVQYIDFDLRIHGVLVMLGDTSDLRYFVHMNWF